jgi:hypothetical protein
MKILEIRNIIKKDLPLHYRNEFSGSLVYETLTKKKEEKRVVAERKPRHLMTLAPLWISIRCSQRPAEGREPR